MNFPTTCWTVLADATLSGDSGARMALGRFYQNYHQPVLTAIQARGLPGEEAKDVAQAFFLHLMEHQTLSRADRSRGRFRSYLYRALHHFMADQYDRATAARRGGGAQHVPLESAEHELGAGDTRDFDHEWALAILQRALTAVQAERPPHVFAAVRAFLPGSPGAPTYAEAAAASGLSESALRTEVSRVRRRLRDLIRSEVARTVDAPHEIDAEMTWLHSVLNGG